MRMKLTMSALGLCALVLSTPGTASAQTCFYCSDESVNGVWSHKFGSSGALFDCGDLCHTAWYRDLCWNNHSVCRVALNEQIEQVRTAVERSDLTSLRALLRALGDRAVVNRKARTVDVLSCDSSRTLVARFPIVPGTLAALGRSGGSARRQVATPPGPSDVHQGTRRSG